VIEDPDIYRAAKLVMDQQGEEAATFAGDQANQLLEDGDIDGALVWRRILEAIE
jgi:spermidine/putrescine-binding protein